jgi:hypothetical protein
MIDESQHYVNGVVRVKLYKGNVILQVVNRMIRFLMPISPPLKMTVVLTIKKMQKVLFA